MPIPPPIRLPFKPPFWAPPPPAAPLMHSERALSGSLVGEPPPPAAAPFLQQKRFSSGSLIAGPPPPPFDNTPRALVATSSFPQAEPNSIRKDSGSATPNGTWGQQPAPSPLHADMTTASLAHPPAPRNTPPRQTTPQRRPRTPSGRAGSPASEPVTLRSIARDTKTSIEALRALNPEVQPLGDDDAITPGTQLRIPLPDSDAPDNATSEEARSGGVSHPPAPRNTPPRQTTPQRRPRTPSGRAGSPASEPVTLRSIARDTKTSIEALRALNPEVQPLGDDDAITPGTQLRIPLLDQYSSPRDRDDSQPPAPPEEKAVMRGASALFNPQDSSRSGLSPMLPAPSLPLVPGSAAVERSSPSGAPRQPSEQSRTTEQELEENHNKRSTSANTFTVNKKVETRASSATATEDGTSPQTLAGIANLANIPLSLLLSYNKGLAELYHPYEDILPAGTSVELPPRGGDDPKDLDDSRNTPLFGNDSKSVRSNRSEMVQTQEVGESLLDVARNTGIEVSQIVALNPNLAQYSVDKPLPMNLVIQLPPQADTPNTSGHQSTDTVRQDSNHDKNDLIQVKGSTSRSSSANKRSLSKGGISKDNHDSSAKALCVQSNKSASREGQPPSEARSFLQIAQCYGLSASRLVAMNYFNLFDFVELPSDADRHAGAVCLPTERLDKMSTRMALIIRPAPSHQYSSSSDVSDYLGLHAKKLKAVLDAKGPIGGVDAGQMLQDSPSAFLEALFPYYIIQSMMKADLPLGAIVVLYDGRNVAGARLHLVGKGDPLSHTPAEEGLAEEPLCDGARPDVGSSSHSAACQSKHGSRQSHSRNPSEFNSNYEDDLLAEKEPNNETLRDETASESAGRMSRTRGSEGRERMPSLGDVAREHETSVARLRQLNPELPKGLTDEEPLPHGLTLHVPGSTEARDSSDRNSAGEEESVPHAHSPLPVPAPAPACEGPGYFTVVSDGLETLGVISVRHRVPLHMLLACNDKHHNDIGISSEHDALMRPLPKGTVVRVPANYGSNASTPQASIEIVQSVMNSAPALPAGTEGRSFITVRSPPRNTQIDEQQGLIYEGLRAIDSSERDRLPPNKYTINADSITRSATKTIIANGTDTVRDVCLRHALTEAQLRAMNPFLYRYLSTTVIPRSTVVVVSAAKASPASPGGKAPPKALNDNRSTERSMNRRHVAHALAHRSAKQLAWHYYQRWRLYIELFSKKRLKHAADAENERETLRLLLRAGQITESDLKKRVTELRMALDISRGTGLMGNTLLLDSARIDRRLSRQADESSHLQVISSPQRLGWDNGAIIYHSQSLAEAECISSIAAATVHGSGRTPPKTATLLLSSPSNAVQMSGNTRLVNAIRDHGRDGGSVSPRSRQTPLCGSELHSNDNNQKQSMDTSQRAVASLVPVKTSNSPRGTPERRATSPRYQKGSLGLLLNGLKVARVTGAAIKAGIQPNDTIIRVDGALVASSATLRTLINRCQGPFVSLTLQTPTGHVFTTMLPLRYTSQAQEDYHKNTVPGLNTSTGPLTPRRSSRGAPRGVPIIASSTGSVSFISRVAPTHHNDPQSIITGITHHDNRSPRKSSPARSQGYTNINQY